MFSLPNKNRDRKQAKPEAETGEEFYKEESFSMEIQAEREYVQRLKMQREKIEALYTKYDTLLAELKKKDDRIKQLERNLSNSNYKYKELELMLPQLEMSKHDNYRLYNENEALKGSINKIEESYNDIIRQLNTKSNINEQQYEKIGEINAQLTTKIRIWQQKLQDKSLIYEKEKKALNDRIDTMQKELDHEKAKHLSEISILNEELLKKDEELDIIHHQLQKQQENIVYLQQANIDLSKDHELKVSRIHTQYKNRIKTIKQQIEQLNYNNEMLGNKITLMSSQIQKINNQNSSLRNSVCQEKKLCDETLYNMKLQFNQEKSLMREHLMQLQAKNNKLEKQLANSLTKEKNLMDQINKFYQGESVKKSIREIERRELDKINRLLLLEK